jgi:predicted HD superfamily hydrolase involved in NAD metabolism
MNTDLQQIDSYLKKYMSKERYQHSWQVGNVAEKIACQYNISSQKAKLLGLIHDCAKDYTNDELKKFIEKYNINLTKIEENIPGLWHAYVGAEIARHLFNIQDQELLEAIKYHSTASRKLTLLGKILYIADKVEPDRKEVSLNKARKMIWIDIDLALLELLNRELKSLICRNLIIHPETLHTRNKILKDKGIV